MTTGSLYIDVVSAAASALAGGLLLVLTLMTTFVVVGQALLVFQRSRAAQAKPTPGHTCAKTLAASSTTRVRD